MIAFAVLLVFGFASMWPGWLHAVLGMVAGLGLLAVMGLALVLGLPLAFILIVHPPRR
ncbi:MAG: hypothetical protein J0I72_00595 [Stenotrophomonas sp.]|nr:hypothetical protein [Xanthomonadales bacterium]MBN8767835.1 hypothetical protein [Stenotrophomonas sp.]